MFHPSKVLCILSDVNIKKMKTEVNLLGRGKVASDAEGRLQPFQTRYKHMVETTGKGNPGKFHVNKGWLEKFRNHYNLQNSRLTGEEE